jgi:arginine exporter protein ArgO
MNAPDNRRTTARHPVQNAAAAVGAVFLLVGILGFVPGITTNYDQLGSAGHTSMAMLLGVFQVSILHNIVHLLFGVAGLALARTARTATHYLIWGGVIYLVLWFYGLVIGHDSGANFVPVNDADNWLHLILAIGMIGLGVALGRTREHAGAAGHRDSGNSRGIVD